MWTLIVKKYYLKKIYNIHQIKLAEFRFPYQEISVSYKTADDRNEHGRE